ncbi:MAG: hypothetical protein OHK0029_29270 [Armatimonadaceae bacterium]
MADEAERQQLTAQVLEFANGVIASAGLDASAETTLEEPDGVTVAFTGPDSRFLVGRGGAVLNALQYLALLSLTKRSNSRFHIIFDADNYRKRREETLRNLASDLARQVLETGQEAVLDPLSPLERRIVHQVLADNPGVRTYSEGEEPERYIVIAPAS